MTMWWFGTKKKGLQPYSAVSKLALNSIGDCKFKKTTWFDWLDNKLYPTVKDHIQYNKPVTEIDYQGDVVKVVTEAGEVLVADRVLVTVPITMLQQEFIKFTPAMSPQKVAAINAEEMPPGFKMFIEFTEKFYNDVTMFESLWGCLTTGEQSAYCDEAGPKGLDKHIICLLARGPRAEEYLEKVKTFDGDDKLSDDDKLVQVVLRQLDEMYDDKASKTYVKAVVQNWTAEPYIRGTYTTTIHPGRGSQLKERVSPLNGKVYFAGEAMNPAGHCVAVHAAIESAYASLGVMLQEYKC